MAVYSSGIAIATTQQPPLQLPDYHNDFIGALQPDNVIETHGGLAPQASDALTESALDLINKRTPAAVDYFRDMGLRVEYRDDTAFYAFTSAKYWESVSLPASIEVRGYSELQDTHGLSELIERKIQEHALIDSAYANSLFTAEADENVTAFIRNNFDKRVLDVVYNRQDSQIQSMAEFLAKRGITVWLGQTSDPRMRSEIIEKMAKGAWLSIRQWQAVWLIIRRPIPILSRMKSAIMRCWRQEVYPRLSHSMNVLPMGSH